MHPSHDLRTSNQDFWFLMLGSWPAVVPAILALAGIPAVTWSLVLPALDSEQRVEVRSEKGSRTAGGKLLQEPQLQT